MWSTGRPLKCSQNAQTLSYPANLAIARVSQPAGRFDVGFAFRTCQPEPAAIAIWFINLAKRRTNVLNRHAPYILLRRVGTRVRRLYALLQGLRAARIRQATRGLVQALRAGKGLRDPRGAAQSVSAVFLSVDD